MDPTPESRDVYIYIDTYIHTYIHACMYVCMYVYIYIRKPANWRAYAYVNASPRISITQPISMMKPSLMTPKPSTLKLNLSEAMLK